ncbi:MAG: glycosyl hydrolase family 28 protein [Verrucomicrobiae bacterium]|nr:glycosyl hydrolase family 28 protein [Verrucomicrobiae bacterium]
MVEFYRCKNLRIEDVQITNSAGWTLRPVECDNVFIRGITIRNSYGVNTDGLDLIGCKNVFVSDSLIDTGDDAICLKSESPYGGDVPVAKNITITNCVLTCCCNGLKFGTASFGRFENITFSNSVIFNEDVPLKSRVISGIALEVVDGGAIEGVMVSNIRMQRVRTPLFLRIGNRHPKADGRAGIIRGVRIENVHATESILTSSITGLLNSNIEEVTLSGIRIESEENGKAGWVNREIPDPVAAYPEARMFGRLPAYGLFCRHVKGLNLHQVELGAGDSEERPAIFCDRVKNLKISGLNSTPTAGDQPVIKLNQVTGASIQGCTTPPGAKTYLEIQGDQTRQIVLANNNLVGSEKAVSTANDVPHDAVVAVFNAGGQ